MQFNLECHACYLNSHTGSPFAIRNLSVGTMDATESFQCKSLHKKSISYGKWYGQNGC
jgi:hypothetical protein